MSIVETIMNQLSGDVLAKLSTAAGATEEQTKAAAGAAVPAVLSSLANSVLSGKGFDGLLEALRGFDGTDPVESLRTPGGDGSSPVGVDVLGTLLGPNLAKLIEILSKFSGVGVTVMKTLLGYLGPIILSAIAAQFKGAGGLTPANLTSFFTAEKGGISGAMPAGLSLADLPSIPGVPTSAPTPKAPASSRLSWLMPAIIVAIGAIAVYFYLNSPPEPREPETAAVPSDSDIPPAPEVEGALPIPTADEVSKGLSGIYDGATQTLADVKDAATAEAAVPKLQGLDARLDVLKSLWGKIPAEAKATVAKVTLEHLDTIKSLVSKVLEIPGAAEKLKPILDAVLEKLAGFAV